MIQCLKLRVNKSKIVNDVMFAAEFLAHIGREKGEKK